MAIASSPSIYLTIDTGTHSSTIHRLLVTPDGKSIITASMDKTIRLWDVASKKPARKLLGEIGPDDNGNIGRIALDPEGRYLYVTAWWQMEGTGATRQHVTFLRVYSLQSGNLESVYRHPGNVADMWLSEDGKYLALCCDQPHQILLFNPQDILHAQALNPTPLATVDIDPRDHPKCLRIYRLGDAYSIVCGNVRARARKGSAPPDSDTAEGEVQGSGSLCWYTLDAQGLHLNKTLQLFGRNTPLHMAVNSQYLVTNGEEETGLLCYDLHGQFIQRIAPNSPRDALPASMTFSADGSRLIAGALGDRDPVRVRVYDATNGFSLKSEYTGHDDAAQVGGFLADGTAVSAGGTHYEIHFWDASQPQGKRKAKITGAGQVVYGVGLKDASRIGLGNQPIVSAGEDDLDSFALLQRSFDLRNFGVSPLDQQSASAFQRAVHQRERQRLRMGSDDNLWLVRGWHRKRLTEAPDPEHPGETLWVNASTFGFTEQGSLITGDADGDVRVALRDGNGEFKSLPWRTLHGHSSAVQDHAAQGNWLVTAGMDQTMALWYLPDVEQDSMRELDPALRLFVASDNEWVLWSASGYYDASLHGDRYVGYHVNQGERQEAVFYPSDRFIKQLYRPDIIRAIVQDGSEDRALARLGIQKPDLHTILPPVIELKDTLQGNDTLTLNVEVRPGAAGAPVKRVWALRNDRVAWEQRGPEVAGDDSASRERAGRERAGDEDTGSTLLSAVIPLQPGVNRIKLLAESEFAKSNPLVMTLGGDATNPVTPLPGAVWKAEHATLSFEVAPPPGLDARLQVRHGASEEWASVSPQDGGRVTVSLAEGENDIAISGDSTGVRYALASVNVTLNPASSSDLAGDTPLADGVAKGLGTDSTASVTPNGTLYLLAVGVAKLLNPSGAYQNLNYADDDAQAIYNLFTSPDQKAFQNVVAKLLLNEQATCASIYAELENLKAAINTGAQDEQRTGTNARDVLLIYMSGHGLIRNGEFYYWNYDYDDTNPLATGVRFLDLGEHVSGVPAELIVMTDACQSGQGGTDLANVDANELAKRLIAVSERAQYILNGTTRETESIESDSIRHGVFTYCLLDGMKKLSAVSPSGVMLLELGGYVQERVPYFTQKFDTPQVPTIRTYGELLPLYIYRP